VSRTGGANEAVKSLNAKLTTGAGASFNLGEARAKHALQVFHTGGPTTCIVTLEGRLDDTAPWFVLATWTTLTSGDIVFAVDKPVTQIRANLTTLAGGAAPAVTAFIAANQD